MKTSLRFGCLVALLLTALAAPAWTQTATYAIQGAKIYTMAGPPIEGGTVVIAGGKIIAVGKDVKVPSGAKVINAKGLEVYPGMFDPVTQLGLQEVSAVAATVDVSEVGAYNPDVVAATAVNPASEHIPVVRASGITEALSVPGVSGGLGGGGGNVIGGQASAIYTSGWTYDDLMIKKSVAMSINWPSFETRTFDFVTFTIRERPFSEVKQAYEKRINELTEWLDRTRHYAQAMEKGPGTYQRDLKLEALVPVVQGKLPLLVVANQARDIRNAVEYCEKQNLKMILAGGADAWKVKELLKEKNISVVLGPTERLPLHEDDAYDQSFATPGELNAAGVTIAFASFANEFSRRLPYYAGNAVAYGLPREEALKAVTVNAAKIFGLEGELGTIQPGKVANILVTDGDLLELRTGLRYLFIKGVLTSQENKHHQLYEEYSKRP
jgi:imidazolonepropionase-like amidohydrolase